MSDAVALEICCVLPNLKSLNLASTSVTSASVLLIAQRLPYLRDLNLYNCNLGSVDFFLLHATRIINLRNTTIKKNQPR